MRILSLNIWGTPLARARQQRLEAIAAEIQRLDPDVIALQEVFVERDRDSLIGALGEQWPHFHAFGSSVVGSGLLTLSRYPIVDVAFLRYRLGGKPEKIWHGDYFGGKGIGLVRLQTPEGMVDVYNSHPHAQYDLDNDNEYAVFTNSNLYEAARFINAWSDENPVVLCGDLNARPDQLGYRLILSMAGLRDGFTAVHPNDPGDTFTPPNPYVKTVPQRLDYIMLRDGEYAGWRVSDIAVTFNDPLPQDSKALAYSDHFGLMAEIEATQSPNQPRNDSVAVLSELRDQLHRGLGELEMQQSGANERALLSLAGIIDAQFITGWIAKRLKLNGLRWFATLTAMLVGAGYFLYSRGVLEARHRTMEALLDEVEIALKTARQSDHA